MVLAFRFPPFFKEGLQRIRSSHGFAFIADLYIFPSGSCSSFRNPKNLTTFLSYFKCLMDAFFYSCSFPQLQNALTRVYNMSGWGP